MDFVNPHTYTDLCPKCRATLVSITDLFVDGLMPDTDDEEAPCMYLYDHGMFCQGSECRHDLVEVENA